MKKVIIESALYIVIGLAFAVGIWSFTAVISLFHTVDKIDTYLNEAEACYHE